MNLILQYLPKYNLIIKINKKKKIIQNLHNPTNQIIPTINEIKNKNEILYFDSYNLPYLNKLYLQKYKKTKH